MKELDGLMEFCAVVENGGFKRAAESLDVSTSFISRRVSNLENRLGVLLLHRTTRSVNLTDIGEQYYLRSKAILADIHALSADLAEQQNLVKGRIRVAAGGIFGETWVASALADFARLHPEVELDLEISDRPVDLVREKFDLAIRHGMPSDPDLTVSKIGSRRMMVCASPDYLREHGEPNEPEDLVSHSCLITPGLRWLFARYDDTFEVRVSGRWASNNGRALMIAASAGLGFTRLAEGYLTSALKSGALVAVLKPYEISPQETLLVYPSRAFLPFRIRSLVEHLKKY
ncbi:LysR substrate-binding domain-containing protein [Pseudovibrio ascidiaceicola]|uniref:LysR family transcriptional regulator n=1 Tax=Pseudovibrio ascidiaceicola TaxID=285279 RepID=UPI003D365863